MTDKKTMTTDKKFDAVNYMRKQRQQLSEKLGNMAKEEIVAYFKRKKLENTVEPSA